jgi:hypothetical protein
MFSQIGDVVMQVNVKCVDVEGAVRKTGGRGMRSLSCRRMVGSGTREAKRIDATAIILIKKSSGRRKKTPAVHLPKRPIVGSRIGILFERNDVSNIQSFSEGTLEIFCLHTLTKV